MKAYALFVISILCLFCTRNSHADGKMYLRQDRIPANIPYQRALILFDHGRETLVVQSKYSAHGLKENAVGWVIPVPNVPDVTSVAADAAATAFWKLEDISYPAVTHFLPQKFCLRILGIVFLFSLAYMFLMPVIVLTRCVKDKSCRPLKQAVAQRTWPASYAMNFLVFLLTLIILPNFIRYRGGNDVDIVQEKEAGIYNIRVIRSDQGKSLVEWLNSNGFRFNAADQEAFDFFIHKNWCFVTAQINAQNLAATDELISEGLAAPLILGFNTEQPVYPLKLTGTAGSPTEILLYIYAKKKMQCGDKLELNFAGESSFDFFASILSEMIDTITDKQLEQFMPISGKGYLTKCKGTLQPDQMKSDIWFLEAENSTAYRKKIKKVL
ncbi:MAG: DUF2330 domain-containing protein [Candidatus Electrothrix sp. YB6]